MKLSTLADVRDLVEKHLPAQYRPKPTWRHRDWYDAGNAPVARMQKAADGFKISCPIFESKGLPCCSGECERTIASARKTLAYARPGNCRTAAKQGDEFPPPHGLSPCRSRRSATAQLSIYNNVAYLSLITAKLPGR